MNFDTNVLQVAIEDIIPNRFQPRLSFEDTALNELAASIKQHGIIQPLVLRKNNEKYEIVAGERRYKAAMLAGLSSVPAVIAMIDDKTSAEVAVAENVQRKELTAIEEARSYRALLDQGYMSQEQLARKMGVSLSSLENKLRLLTLCNEVQDAVLENRISERHARSLLILKDENEQRQVLSKIINERLTVRQLDELLKQNNKGGNMNQAPNINQLKSNATDISAHSFDSFANNNSLELGPIDLGVQTAPGHFGDLEAEAVNMQMTEVNPFDNHINPVLAPSTPAPKQEELTSVPLEPAISNDFIDSLDALDFEPQPNINDLSKAKVQIDSVINDLKNQNFNIEVQEKNENGQIVYTIIIKNTDK